MSATWRCPIRGLRNSPPSPNPSRSFRRASPSWTSRALCAAPRRAKGWATSSSPISARSMPIAHVLRCFEDGDITHVEGRIDPVERCRNGRNRTHARRSRQPRTPHHRRIEKKAKSGEKEAKEQFALMTKAIVLLREGKPARQAELTPEEREPYRQLGLMTQKPVLYVCNVEEASAADRQHVLQTRRGNGRSSEGAGCVVISARIEEEVAQLRGRRARGIPPEPRSRGTRPQPADPRGLCAARPHHLLHRGAERSARLDRDERLARAAGRRRHPHRFREGLHPRRDHRL